MVARAEVRDSLRGYSLHDSVRTFRETGLVVVEAVYTRKWIASLNSKYSKLIERYLTDRGGAAALEGKTFGKHHLGIHPALVPPWSDPEIVAHPVVDELLVHLLGKDYQCGFYNTNTAYPGSGIQPVHRDSPPLFTAAELNVPHPAVNLVFNVPLCDFNEHNGSTEVWPGSHLLVDRSPGDAKDLEARATRLPSIRTNFRAGSVILRDLRLFHRGMPNRLDLARPMLAIVYTRAFRAADRLEIPKSTWDAWPGRARQIFRNNRVLPDAETAAHYRFSGK